MFGDTLKDWQLDAVITRALEVREKGGKCSSVICVDQSSMLKPSNMAILPLQISAGTILANSIFDAIPCVQDPDRRGKEHSHDCNAPHERLERATIGLVPGIIGQRDMV
jgi:hypothetical protein